MNLRRARGSPLEAEYLRGLIFEEIQSTVDELPPERREVFELTEYYDMPVKEIRM